MSAKDTTHDSIKCCKDALSSLEFINSRAQKDSYLRYEIQHVARMIILRLLYENLPLPDIKFVGDETGRTWIKLFWDTNGTSLYIYSSIVENVFSPGYMNMNISLRQFDAKYSSCDFDTRAFDDNSWLLVALIEIKKLIALPHPDTLVAVHE